MPEPSSGRKGLDIPANFDPDKHCGAKLRNKPKLCMNVAGQGTEKAGDPTKRCYLHGGLTPVETGAYSKTYGVRRPKVHRKKLADLIEEMKHSPELLTLDEQIATLRVVIKRKVEITGENWDRYDEYLDAVSSAAQTSGVMPDPVMLPELPTNEIALLGKLVAQEYDMRFSKKFSVPLVEVQGMMQRVIDAFNAVAKQHGISDAARASFAQRVRNLTVGSQPDEQLERAGNGPPMIDAPEIIDVEEIGGSHDAVAAG